MKNLTLTLIALFAFATLNAFSGDKINGYQAVVVDYINHAQAQGYTAEEIEIGLLELKADLVGEEEIGTASKANQNCIEACDLANEGVSSARSAKGFALYLYLRQCRNSSLLASGRGKITTAVARGEEGRDLACAANPDKWAAEDKLEAAEDAAWLAMSYFSQASSTGECPSASTAANYAFDAWVEFHNAATAIFHCN